MQVVKELVRHALDCLVVALRRLNRTGRLIICKKSTLSFRLVNQDGATYDMRATWDLRRFVFKNILHLVLSNERVGEERLLCSLCP